MITHALAPEFEGADRDLRKAPEALLSYAHWDRLRRVQRLRATRVARILQSDVLARLGARGGGSRR